jgi:hypothetical protein
MDVPANSTIRGSLTGALLNLSPREGLTVPVNLYSCRTKRVRSTGSEDECFPEGMCPNALDYRCEDGRFIAVSASCMTIQPPIYFPWVKQRG